MTGEQVELDQVVGEHSDLIEQRSSHQPHPSGSAAMMHSSQVT
jgi:hypothetical protein